jgi:hypothetical protein
MKKPHEINSLQVVPRKKETKPDKKGDPSPNFPNRKIEMGRLPPAMVASSQTCSRKI